MSEASNALEYSVWAGQRRRNALSEPPEGRQPQGRPSPAAMGRPSPLPAAQRKPGAR